MTATSVTDKCIVSTYVAREQRDELLRLATAADRSLSAEIRRALVAHLDRQPDHQETAS